MLQTCDWHKGYNQAHPHVDDPVKQWSNKQKKKKKDFTPTTIKAEEYEQVDTLE